MRLQHDSSFREKLGEFFSSTAVIAVAAFAVRMAIFYFYDNRNQVLIVRDPPFGAETGAVAAAIASGRGFSSPLRFVQTGPTAWFAPIYPYFLAGIFKIFGVFSYLSALVAHTVNIAFSAFTVWPIAAIGARAFGKRVGIASAWVWVVLPTPVFYSTVWVWDTSLAGLWLAILFLETLRVRDSDRLGHWLWYGAAWAIGAMINPSLLAVLPFLALWAIWPLLRSQLPHAAKLALVSSLVFAAGLAPWTIRNYVVFHKFIPLRSNFALELWVGNDPEVPDGFAPFWHPNDNLDEARKYAAMTEIPYMAEKQREAMAIIRSHPWQIVNFTFRRFVDNWIGVKDPPVELWLHVGFYYKFILLSNCLFSLLAWLGALFVYRAKHEAALPFGCVMLFFPMVFYVTHASFRYRFPMDCIMLVLAVYAVAYPVSLLARRPAAMRSMAQPAT
jgi:hypothetical protein